MVTVNGRELSLGDWAKAVHARDGARLKAYGTEFRKTALSEQSGTTGGYLVPTDYAKGMWAVAAEESLFLRAAFRVPMGSRDTLLPIINVSNGAAGVPAFFGGAVFAWKEEAAARSETEPTFNVAHLKNHELTGYALVSNSLMQDADDGHFSEYLTRILGLAAAWCLDYACFSGNGVGKPVGVKDALGRLTVTRAASTDFRPADAANMAGKLLPGSWNTATWAMHASVLPKLGAFGAGAQGILWAGPTGLMLFGRPVFVTEKLPALGTAGDVILFDPRLYALGIRGEIEVAASSHSHFLTNQTAFRVVLRADGQPMMVSSVTLADGAQTASAYVVLN